MTLTLDVVLWLALLAFLAATAGVKTQIDLVALGLAFYMAYLLL